MELLKMANIISPQGYNYPIDPKSEHPFWQDGTPATDFVSSIDFSSAEEDDGSTTYREQVNNSDGSTDVQEINVPQMIPPDITATASVTETTGTPGVSVTKTGEDTAPNYDFAFTGLKGEKGERGETGATGPQGETITRAGLMTDVSMTNENGIYTISQTKYDDTGTATGTTEVGTIEIPEDDRGIVEVKDSVVSNNTIGYDFHTITETQNDGTENEVGALYLGQNQIAILPDNLDGSFNLSYTDNRYRIRVVDQSGAYQYVFGTITGGLRTIAARNRAFTVDTTASGYIEGACNVTITFTIVPSIGGTSTGVTHTFYIRGAKSAGNIITWDPSSFVGAIHDGTNAVAFTVAVPHAPTISAGESGAFSFFIATFRYFGGNYNAFSISAATLSYSV